MAKQMRRLPRLAPVAIAVMLASPACHADWRFQPGISITETYSDNYDLRSDQLAQTQLVTELVPSFSMLLNNRRLKATASAQWHQYIYRDENTRPRADHRRRFGSTLQGILVDDLLMVDASASVGQQSISAFGPRAEDNPYSNENSTEVKTWTISPYLTYNFGQKAGAVLRYTHNEITSDMRRAYGDTVADTVMFNLFSGSAFQTVGWGLSYMDRRQDNELVGDSRIQNLGANLRYRLNYAMSLTATAGEDRYDFEGPGGTSGGTSWTTGFVWTPSTRTSVSAAFGRQYFGNTGSLDARLRSRRTVWNINYSDTITTSRAQFTLPAAIDTAALLDSLFSSTIPDPVQRQLAIAAYMLETGLPPSLADDISFLSNRYMRQKLLQGSAVFQWSRSSAVVGLHASDRTALSAQESDSPLLGSQQSSLNNHVRQNGASAAFTYRLSPRTSLAVSANYDLRQSVSRNIESRQRQLRLSLNRKLGRDAVATLSLRRRSGVVDATSPRDYTEHAITAAISIKL